MSIKRMPRLLDLLNTVARIALGIIFLLAATSKIGDLQVFHRALVDLTFLPQWLAGIATLFVPGFELAIGICLLTRIAIRESALVATLLLIIFICFGLYSAITKSTSSCHCFTLPIPAWFVIKGWWIVGRNLIFLCLSVLIFIGSSKTSPNFVQES